MKTNLNIKLLPVVIIGVTILSVSFLGFSLRTQKANVEKTTLDAIHSTQKTFSNLIADDVKMLQLAITNFSTNQQYKDIFLEENRDKLYRYGQDLFSENKKMGATHFYFIRKEGTVLTRLHNASKYDDKVTRATFQEAKRVKGWGTGIELGQTAFALRVVHPYLNNNELIGYVELGEEIDHFLVTMKEQTGFEYGIVVEKEYIDEGKWASVRSTKGLKDNYNDLKNHVIIETTMNDTQEFLDYSFSTEGLETVSDEGRIFNHFQVDNKSYVSGGFALYDAADRKVGAVVVTQDITSLAEIAKRNNQNVLLIALLGTILICFIMVVLIRGIVVRPLSKVVEAATRVVGGDFKATADVHSKDEIGNLAEMLNMLSQVTANTGLELEDAHRQLDISEKLRKSSDEKLNLVKQRIQQRITQNNKE